MSDGVAWTCSTLTTYSRDRWLFANSPPCRSCKRGFQHIFMNSYADDVNNIVRLRTPLTWRWLNCILQYNNNYFPNFQRCFHTLKFCTILTIKKQAPNITAFIRTSKSRGNEIPKASASVNISRIRPPHCFDILPTTALLSFDKICRSKVTNN